MEMNINRVDDFIITGKGRSGEWEMTDWMPLLTVGNGKSSYETKVKVLWSESGIYFLFFCEDRMISCGNQKNFGELYLEDVVEVFLWPDERHPVYFEYEISPLGDELPLLVANKDGLFHGWLPFLAVNERKILSRTHVEGGRKEPGAGVAAWYAEFIIPFELLIGMTNCPPAPGTRWRANMCRLDYDTSPVTQWSWCREKMAWNFHNYRGFGSFVFR
ncbi:MAG: carbohydrate-binding family 9-like protein [Spirochaetales bacterium]|nr:carbohydrate-binding family 9-like protein [Spirochaetales bacterium]